LPVFQTSDHTVTTGIKQPPLHHCANKTAHLPLATYHTDSNQTAMYE